METTLTTIASAEIAFSPLSYNDENGRLFQWQGDIYRAIPQERVDFCDRLFQEGIIEDLVGRQLLVDTELTSLKVEGYAWVLKHRRIEFVSYPKEWCGAMVKDAALLHLDFCRALTEYDLKTADANPFNILYEGCQAIFIDFGSIKPIETDYPLWSGYSQFCRFFLNPLKLMALGRGRVARWLMQDYERGVQPEDLEPAVTPPMVKIANRGKQKIIRFWGRLGGKSPPIAKKRQQFWQQLHQEVTSLKPICVPAYRSSATYDWLESTFISGDRQTKVELFAQLLKELQPKSVLELGSDRDRGNYAQIAAGNGLQTVFITPEEALAEAAYQQGKAENLPLLPLLIDIASPSSDLTNSWLTGAGDRLGCDLVVACDLLVWLVFRRFLPFDRIAERLADFTRHWLLVEFVLPQEIDVAALDVDLQAIFAWYDLDNFTAALNSQFSRVSVRQHCEDRSVLLLCQR